MKTIVITAGAIVTMLGVTCYAAPKKGRAVAAKAAAAASSTETKPRRQVLQGEAYVKDRAEFQLRFVRAEKIALSNWTDSRRTQNGLALTEAEKLVGNALLSEFGTKYLPNAYANYEKKRDAAFELQQVVNEEFPDPWSIKEGDPKWAAFNKVLGKFMFLRADYFWSRDELIHYWYMLKLGVLDAADLVKLDMQKLSPCLLPAFGGDSDVQPEYVKLLSVTGDERTFAMKYSPESNALYQKLEQARSASELLLTECRKARVQMDDCRYSRAIAAQQDKHDDIARVMNDIAKNIKTWRTEHRTTLKSSEEVAKCDQELANRIKPFVESLPNYVKTRVLGPIIPESDMIQIPTWECRMQRTELTQLQWMLVMGYNPADTLIPSFRGARKPVVGFTLAELAEFVRCLNKLDGQKYTIPTRYMWSNSCRAGEIETKIIVSRVAWCNLSKKESGLHSVGMKEPNEWGFYDMIGNVAECCFYNPGCLYTPVGWMNSSLNVDFYEKLEFNGGSWLCVKGVTADEMLLHEGKEQDWGYPYAPDRKEDGYWMKWRSSATGVRLCLEP
jgi:hypothetical protein